MDFDPTVPSGAEAIDAFCEEGLSDFHGSGLEKLEFVMEEFDQTLVHGFSFEDEDEGLARDPGHYRPSSDRPLQQPRFHSPSPAAAPTPNLDWGVPPGPYHDTPDPTSFLAEAFGRWAGVAERQPTPDAGNPAYCLAEGTRLAYERRSCHGCCTGPALGNAMDGPSKGLRVEDREAKKQCLRENFPSPSTCEINSTVWSQRSMTSAQSNDFPSNIGSSTDFVYSGLLLWNETRKQWIGNKISESKKQVREPKISLNATYESLLTTNRPFPEAIPIAEMIEFLVDVWEQEGLYD